MLDLTLYTPVIVSRFEAKLTDGPGDCWLWTASKDRDGYGHFWPRQKAYRRAHRWSYEYHIGPIPDGLQLDHLCRNRACVNPYHLEPVSARTNTLRGTSFAAVYADAEACIRGHEFTPENTRMQRRKSGVSRQCKECDRQANRSWHQRQKASNSGG